MPQRRRQKIIKTLAKAAKPVKGAELSEILGVSRQVIVQDIALLRAEGEQIIATPQGYFLIDQSANHVNNVVRVFACRHDSSRGMEKELRIMVENGGKVLDVIVEHPLYGELKGNLMLGEINDVSNFIENLEKSGAEPLSVLTKGIHLHTVEAPSQSILDKIQEGLKKEKLLV
ncbi:MAG: transcription repressor NadR [Peptococcaceae bacterium]